MFERFTDRSRRVLVLAQEEARLLGHNFIGTEHILLGLLAEGEGVAARALELLGISPDAVRRRVEETVGPPGSSSTGSPPFTPRAKKVLELSLREALQLGHNYIGTEHMLLGLVREGHGVGAGILVSLGADLAGVRQQVIQVLQGYSPREADGAMTVGSLAPGDGPRCPACRGLLEGHVGYRVLPVPAVQENQAPGTIEVIFVYCLRCGVIAAHAPAAGVEAFAAAGAAAAAPTPIQLAVRGGQVAGTVHGEGVQLDLGERAHDMTVTGSFAGAAVSATVVHDDNSASPTGLAARLEGSFGDEPAELHFSFELEPSYLFRHGEVMGVVAGAAVRAMVRRALGASTSTISVSGTWADDRIELSAGVGGDLQTGYVRGAIGQAPVYLAAKAHGSLPERPISITGVWGGPPASLALAVGALLYFM